MAANLVWFNAEIEARFWKHVDRRQPDECWPWKAARVNGYGAFKFGRDHSVKASRLSLAIAGRNPGELDVLHRCNNRACVNPDHLYAGTDAENTRDKILAGTLPRGETHGRAKLREIDVRNMRALYAATSHLPVHDRRRFSANRLSRMFGVSDTVVSKTLRRELWRCVA